MRGNGARGRGDHETLRGCGHHQGYGKGRSFAGNRSGPEAKQLFWKPFIKSHRTFQLLLKKRWPPAACLVIWVMHFFLVDPLDGTKEFLKRNGQFTVNIGLIENGVPTMGIVYAPAMKKLYYGVDLGEAYAQDLDPKDGVAGLDKSTPHPISARLPPANGMTAVSSGSHKHETVEKYLSQFQIVEHREMGSSLKFCLVATGEADIYPRQPESSCEWDVAAAHGVLRAAGGDVTQLDGSVFEYGHAERKFLNTGFVAHGKRSAG